MSVNESKKCDSMVEGEVLVIGAGTLGSRIVGSAAYPQDANIRYVVLERGTREVSLPGHIEYVALPSMEGKKTVGDPIQAAKDTRACVDSSSLKADSAIMVVLVAGLGGGVGSGSLPVLAEYFKLKNVPVIVLVSHPDPARDGRKRFLTAEMTIRNMERHVDGFVYLGSGARLPSGDLGWMEKAFKQKLEVLTRTLTTSGMIPIDFSCVLKTLSGSGKAAIVSAHAFGKDRAREAALSILSDMYVQSFLGKPARVVVHIVAGPDLTLFELDEAAMTISERWGAEVDVTYGAVIKQDFEGLQLDVIVGGGGCEAGVSATTPFQSQVRSSTTLLSPEKNATRFPASL